MRAPFQALTIPYRYEDGKLLLCVFHRLDDERIWQFISGGGEDAETPIEAACREVLEEAGIRVSDLMSLTSRAHVPTCFFDDPSIFGWPSDTYVIPEYTFAFVCEDEPHISEEHTEYAWMTFDEAWDRLYYDSNRTAMYELRCRLENKDINKK